MEKGLRPLRMDFARLGKRFIAHASWTKAPSPSPFRLIHLHYNFLAIFFLSLPHMHPDFLMILIVYVRPDTGSILLIPRSRGRGKDLMMNCIACRLDLIGTLIDKNNDSNDICVNYQYLKDRYYVTLLKN